MSRFRYVAPERLQFREGGGCLSLFGMPFLLAGLFMLLSAAGVISISGGGDMARPVLGLMGLAFTAVGAVLVFGRTWSVLDLTERAAIKSWGLLVPFRASPRHLDEFTRVSIGFAAGDSDSSETYPVTLKARSGPDFLVCRPTAYHEARASAAEAAKHLGFALEDASGDHATTIDPADIDRSFHERMARQSELASVPERPPQARSEVHQETNGVRLVIPNAPVSVFSLAFVLVPFGIFAVFGPRLWEFFDRTRTPLPVAIGFLGLLTFLFGVLPAIAVANGYVRSRVGHTEVHVTPQGIHVRERRAWRTSTLARLDAAQILDVDYGTRDSGLASARHAVEQRMMEAGREPAAVGPRLERWMATTARWATARGVIVKSRNGLTSFGQGLDDDEIRYVYAVVRQALAPTRRLR